MTGRPPSFLAPLGWIFGRAAALRRQAFARGLLRPERLMSPVVSVGGLSMGGSMKTPTVIELAYALASRGPAVGVLGHGYLGADPAPRVVSDGESLMENASVVGDEAVLTAYELPGCPVVTGRDKVSAGRLLEERFGKRIILVDSGFQHLRLFRDLDIVCVNEHDLGERVMPAGMLRESPSSLRFAHLIFTDRDTDGERVAALRARRPQDVFTRSRAGFAFFPFDGVGEEGPPPERAFVFCGIGWPERFVQDVADRGVSVVGRRFFRDHHPFTEHDLRELASEAEAKGATAAVTTAKDAVRIPSWPGAVPLLAMTARLDIERMPEVLKRIDRAIMARMKGPRR